MSFTTIQSKAKDLQADLAAVGPHLVGVSPADIQELRDLMDSCHRLLRRTSRAICDRSSGQVWIEEECIPLGQSPHLFKVFEILSQAEKPVQKRNLARVLWPGEIYRPLTHDPRIFDLIRRARGLLHRAKLESVSLIGSAQGYLLHKK